MDCSAPSSLPQHPTPGPSEPPPPHPAYIHILIGKVRRPRQQQERTGAAPPPPPEYDSLWATFHMRRSTISYEGFQAAVSASANEVVAAAQQQQPEDKAAVTVFSPLGQYTLHHVTPQPPNPQPRHFNPPPASLLTLPSRRTPPDPKRPIWVDFYIHSNPQPAGPDHQTKFTSELKTRLGTLNAKLSNGPGRRNTLGLVEIPAAALQVSPNPNPGGGDGGPLLLIPPPISRRDWACAVEMYLLATTLNGLGPSASSPPGGDPSLRLIMHEAVTQLGRLSDPRLLRESFEELLRYLGEGNLCLAYADEAVAAAMEGALRGTAVGDDGDDHETVSRPLDVNPGFMELMMAFLEENFFRMVEDHDRVFLQEVRARPAGLG